MTWWHRKWPGYIALRNSLAQDIALYQVSVPELFTMDIVNLYQGVGFCMPMDRLAVTSYEECSPWRGLHREDYFHAIDNLVGRNLLQQLTTEQVREWEVIRADTSMPSCVDKDFQCQDLDIDFTAAGYELYGRIQMEFLGRVRLGYRYDADVKTVTILGESEEAVRECTVFLVSGLSPFESARSTEDQIVKAELKEVVGPTRIGPWRLSKFEVVPSGFMTVLKYE